MGRRIYRLGLVSATVGLLAACAGTQHPWNGTRVAAPSVQVRPVDVFRDNFGLTVSVDVDNDGDAPIEVRSAEALARFPDGHVVRSTSNLVSSYEPVVVAPGYSAIVWGTFPMSSDVAPSSINVDWSSAVLTHDRPTSLPPMVVAPRN
jgi:hypothetical protein